MSRRARLAVLSLAALLGPARGAAAEPDAPERLEGVPAAIRTLGAGWERAAQTPAAGEFRVVFRGPKAQCEARVFAVKDVTAPRTVLMEAADLVSRQVGGDGFGLTGVELGTLAGHPYADGALTVQAAGTRLEGRMRLLRATPLAWALAWGLAPVDAAAEVRAAASAFARTLEPTEPAFYEPSPAVPDPEEPLLVAPGEASLVRRELDNVRVLLEAGLGVRFPRGSRAQVLELLVAEGRAGGPPAREALRGAARMLGEWAGKPAAEQGELARALGAKMLEGLMVKSDAGVPHAQALGALALLGRQPIAGSPDDGFSRLEARALVESWPFLVALAADAPVDLGTAWIAAQRDAFKPRWPSLAPEDRAALRAAARLAPDLEQAWLAATPSERFGLRAALAARLLPEPPASPLTDPARLRAHLDARRREPVEIGAALAALPPRELLALLERLPAPASR